jgi:hypothetical protein
MHIAVIGAGLTGCITALGFADRGHRVTIFERASRLLSRASTANEGKIHLGYVFSADPSFHTAERLIDDALLFRPLVERWISAADFTASVCDPFVYAVPTTSALPLAAITGHFARVDARIRIRMEELGLTYLGQPAPVDFRPLPDFGVDGVSGFLTQERAVWPQGISAPLTRAIERHPRIGVSFTAEVDRVVEKGEKWRVGFTRADAKDDGPFDIVVNAAWADRRNIDRRSGHPSVGTWFTRYKFGVVLHHASQHLPNAIPQNITATSGPFGDCVYYPANDSLYASWYPVGMCFSTTTDQLEQPVFSPADAQDLMSRTWQGCASFAPALGTLAALATPPAADLVGDFIIAKGRSDIHDPESGLHQRSDHGPARLARGYWSIETGKYVSAPRCAMECVERSLAEF